MSGLKSLLKGVVNVATLGNSKREHKAQGLARELEARSIREANQIADQVRAHQAEVMKTAKSSQELLGRQLAQSQARRTRGAGANAFGEYETSKAPLNTRLG